MGRLCTAKPPPTPEARGRPTRSGKGGAAHILGQNWVSTRSGEGSAVCAGRQQPAHFLPQDLVARAREDLSLVAGQVFFVFTPHFGIDFAYSKV